MARSRFTPRGERRARARAHQELIKDLERLARLAPGGAPARPVVVESPAQVEIIAAATPCPLCDARLKVESHDSEVHAGIRLRVVRVACVECGVKRELWFRLAAPALH